MSNPYPPSGEGSEPQDSSPSSDPSAGSAQTPPPHNSPPYPGYEGNPYQQPGMAPGPAGWQAHWTPPPPTHPNAVPALIVSIVSLVVCGGVISPLAWYLGSKAVKEIDENPQRYSGRAEANAGKIIGIIGTVLLILGVFFFVLFFVFIVVLGLTISGTSTYYDTELYGSVALLLQRF